MAHLSTNFADPLLAAAGPGGDAARAEAAARIQAAKDAEFHSLGLVLGYHYGSSPVIVADGTPEPAVDPSRYVPSIRPGARLAHCWLPDGRSLYDALGHGFTLVCLDRAVDPTPFVRAAANHGTPLVVVDAHGPEWSSVQLATSYDAALLLVRPDQHVAWGTSEPVVGDTTAARVLDHVTGRRSLTAGAS
jgi:hypothetical protein